MPTCEQCHKVPSTRIWSPDGHFPGVYLCANCNTKVGKKTEALALARRGRGTPKPTEFTQGKSRKRHLPAPKIEKPTRSASPQSGHRPGQFWSTTSCLCECHYEATVGCSDKTCAAWKAQLAAPKTTNTLPVLEDIAW